MKINFSHLLPSLRHRGKIFNFIWQMEKKTCLIKMCLNLIFYLTYIWWSFFKIFSAHLLLGANKMFSSFVNQVSEFFSSKMLLESYRLDTCSSETSWVCEGSGYNGNIWSWSLYFREYKYFKITHRTEEGLAQFWFWLWFWKLNRWMLNFYSVEASTVVLYCSMQKLTK